MSICFFGADRQTKYRCTYELDEGITVSVEYDVSDEVESVNGMKIWSTSTKIPSRDIIVADPDTSSYILIRNAYYNGNTARYGSIDDRTISRFSSDSYFKCNNLESVLSISELTSFSKLKIFSKEVNRQIGSPSLSYTRTDEVTQIELKNKSQKECVLINNNNIKNITIGDDWICHREGREHLDVCITGYIEIELETPVAFDECYLYMKELAIYLQLFKAGAFEFEKFQLFVGTEYVEYCTIFDEINLKKRSIQNSVDSKLIEFLAACYRNIPYRDGQEETRNIPYIIIRRYRSLEDNFLTCFRFIECYYKRTTNLTSNSDVLTQALIDHPQNISNFKTLGADYKDEIIALRNQYVHTGFYLKNNTLERKNQQGLVRAVYPNITAEWIYERTKLLYQIVVDIIFKTMLGYDKYNYDYR